MASTRALQFAYGCRHPDTAPGSQDRAYVAAKWKDTPEGFPTLVAGVFHDGKVFCIESTVRSASRNYKEHFRMGWSAKMTPAEAAGMAATMQGFSCANSERLYGRFKK